MYTRVHSPEQHTFLSDVMNFSNVVQLRSGLPDWVKKCQLGYLLAAVVP